MPASSATLRQAAAKAGHAAAYGDAERIEQTRRDLAAERIAAYIEKVVSAAPPLTEAQRSRLATLLQPQATGIGASSPPGATRTTASPRRNHERREASFSQPCPDEAA